MPNDKAHDPELVCLLQHLEPEGSRLAHRHNRPMPSCDTLRRKRTELGLTQREICTLYGLIQALSLMGKISIEEGDVTFTIAQVPYNLGELGRNHIKEFLGAIDGMDITHLSKFENGQQVPWTRARARLTLLFSLIEGRRYEVFDIFPELESLPGLKSKFKGGGDNLLEI